MYGLKVKDNPAMKTKKSDWEAKGVIRIRAHGPQKIRKFFLLQGGSISIPNMGPLLPN